MVFMFFGRFVLNFFGISLPVLKIAGGPIVAHTAWGMVTASTSLRDAAKRLANPKKESNLEPLKPTAGITIVPGISLAPERVSRHPRRPDFSSERNFVARDTVTHYDAQGAPAPK